MPFLKIDMTLACFHISGISLFSYDLLKITVSIGAITDDSSFSTLGEIPSGPAALCMFSLSNIFCTPFTVIFISGIVGWGKVCGSSVSGTVVSLVNTDLTCLLRCWLSPLDRW